MRLVEVEFTKIVGEGKSLGRKDGKVIFSYGVLPGEVAIVKPVIEKKNFIEAEVVELKTRCSFRKREDEDHYLSCSPWQIINYEKQIEYKKGLIEDFLYQTTKDVIRVNKFYPASNIYRYRTKIEYSFTENNAIFLAFHKRGSYNEKLVLKKGCMLINDKVNNVAEKVVEKLNNLKIPLNILKTVILRTTSNGDVVFSLFVKDESIKIDFSDIKANGFEVIYSNPNSSISSFDKLLYQNGDVILKENISGKKILYKTDCFFQNNIEMFEKAVNEIRSYVYDFDSICDLYCGVGVIGICVGDNSKKTYFLDNNKSSIDLVGKNIEENGIKNAKVVCSVDSKFDDEFLNADVLILDPPRAGVHKNVIKNIFKKLPQRIIYLSCNPITQGRDLAFLLEKYRIVDVIGFDFYPNTPHIENLVVLDKK